MALLWSHREKGVLYQVRAAGSRRRLYTDGVLHTQFNPRRIATGSVWDLLWLPVFFLAAPRIERVLLLGAGAGAVIRQLNMLFQPKEIVAVENNPVHLRVAREFFGVTRQMSVLHQADAAEFVRRYRGGRFDLIIDDLFVARGSVVRRALSCDSRWMKQLVRHLRPAGILCVNFADSERVSGHAVFRLVWAWTKVRQCLRVTLSKHRQCDRGDVARAGRHCIVEGALTGHADPRRVY